MERPSKFAKSLSDLAKVREDGLVLRNMPHVQNNPEIVMEAVRQNGVAIRYASRELQQNHAIIMAALRTDGVFQIMPDIQANREYLLTAVTTHSPQFYRDLPAAFHNDEEVVMAYISGIENATSSKKNLEMFHPNLKLIQDLYLLQYLDWQIHSQILTQHY